MKKISLNSSALQNTITWFANVQTKQPVAQVRYKVSMTSTMKMQCEFSCKHRTFKVEGIVFTGSRKNHPQMPSTSYHTSLDKTNSSNENVFLACPRWKHLKSESLCFSFYCDCKTVFASSNIKILFSVPQLSYRMNKFSPTTLLTKD